MTQVLVAASVVLCCGAAAHAQLLTPVDVANAIAQGRAGQTLQKKCSAKGENGFDLVVEGPVGRVMRAARESKRAGRDFTAADVTLALDGPFVSVTARRDATLSSARYATQMQGVPSVWVPSDATAADRQAGLRTMSSVYRASVVIRGRASGGADPTVLPPAGRLSFSREGRATYGPEPGTDVVALFDLEAFRALPDGAVDVVAFMTDAGEHRCTISLDDRRRLR